MPTSKLFTVPSDPKVVYATTASPLPPAVDRVEEHYSLEAVLLEKNPEASRQLATAWVEEVLHCKEDPKDTSGLPVQHEFVLMKVCFFAGDKWDSMWLRFERAGEPPLEAHEADSTKQVEKKAKEAEKEAKRAEKAAKRVEVADQGGQKDQRARKGFSWTSPKVSSGSDSEATPSNPPHEPLGPLLAKGSMSSLDWKRTSGALDRIRLCNEPGTLMQELVVMKTVFEAHTLGYVRALLLARSVTRHYRLYKLGTANCYFYAAAVIACFKRQVPGRYKDTLMAKRDRRGTFHGVTVFTLDKKEFEDKLWPAVEKELDALGEQVQALRDAVRKEKEAVEASHARAHKAEEISRKEQQAWVEAEARAEAEANAREEERRAKEEERRAKEEERAGRLAAEARIAAFEQQLAELRRQAAQGQPLLVPE